MLAALHVLEAALAITEGALIAVYPERPARLSTEAWLADAIAENISGLETALFRYRIQLRARGLLSHSSS